MAQLCNPLTLQLDQSGGKGSIPYLLLRLLYSQTELTKFEFQRDSVMKQFYKFSPTKFCHLSQHLVERRIKL